MAESKEERNNDTKIFKKLSPSCSREKPEAKRESVRLFVKVSLAIEYGI